MHERSLSFQLSVTKLSSLFSAPLMCNPLGHGANNHLQTNKQKKKIIMSSLFCLMIKGNYFLFIIHKKMLGGT